MRSRVFALLGSLLLCWSPASAIVISEVMYHPQRDETHGEYVEIYNENAARMDLSRWQFTDGTHYTFPQGTVIESHAYLVIARDPNTIMTSYGITNVVGPTSGALNNASDHIILRDSAGGIMAEVDYEDGGKWPVAADGAGHSLSKYNMRGDPMDPDNWRASLQAGGTPGRDNGFQDSYVEAILIAPGDTWKYFKGRTEASSPITAWRQIGFNDTGPLWLSGPTGIGYGDNDDATTLTDMQQGVPPGNAGYWSIFCRKTFTLADPSTIEQLILEIDHDDGFVAYLNGTRVGGFNTMVTTDTEVYYSTPAFNHEASRGNSNPQPPTVLDITSYKGVLQAGTNVLAVQAHNNVLGSSDLSFIPTVKRRNVIRAGQASVPVVINEVKFHTSGTQFIELYNRSNASVNIGRFYLSNDPDNLRLFQISTNTMLGAYGRIAFLRSQLGFTMNTGADRILLTSPSATVVIDARAVEAGPREMSEGRWPDGADDWYYMSPTTGTANTVTLNTSVVINEIMYHPLSGLDTDEYIELYNVSASPVNMGGWSFTRGVSFDFTSTMTIPAGQYRVVAKDRNRLISRYSLSPTVVWGNYQGNLDDGGEKIRLRDANMNVADEVTYADGGHWSQFADGVGSSLELIDPRHDNSNYQAWAASDETAKAQWRQYYWSGSFNPPTNIELQEIQMNLMGAGVVLLDDIVVTDGSTNYINETFESGAGAWTIMGNHVQSVVTNQAAHGGVQSLRLISTGRGDTGCNHIERDASPAMPVGARNYTISFWARWQWGNRVMSVRLLGSSGNAVPETVMFDVPQLTGTPGAINSVYRANLGPVFRAVSHAPVIPNPSTAVQIVARAYDPNGVASVTLYYKANSDVAYLTTPMYDDGGHGDEAAGDGVYGGQIPARAAGQTVAFYLRGTDGLAAVNTWPTDISRPALYRVENNPLTHTFPTYRIIMTAADENTMYNVRPKLSNEEMNCTFIYNESEVHYNCGVRFIGSPFHRAGGGYTGLKVAFNADDKLHGRREEVRVDNQGGGTPLHDRMSYQLQRWMGLPNCQLEWSYVVCDALENQVLEDTLPPGGEYLDMYYRGDEDGYLFELDDRFWYPNDNDLDLSGFQYDTTTFAWLGTDKDVYRHNFEPRNHGNEDDYTSVVRMLDIMNNTPDAQYDAAIAQIINVETWFKLFAIRACISDWDFIAFSRGKNCYIYWPSERGKWDLLGWDSELTFGDSGMSIWSGFAPVLKFQQRGRHLHFYFTYLREMLDKYFTRAMMDPWIDYWFSQVGGDAAGMKSFIDARRNYLLGLLPTAVCDILTNGGNPITVTTPTVALNGTAPVQVRWVRVNGVDYYLDWTGATVWRGTFPVPGGSNLMTLTFLNYDKSVVGTDSIWVTFTPPVTASIVINAGATYTTAATVALTLAATGTLPVSQMRFSNDNVTWTSWENYATAKTWTLGAGDGVKTVYFQARDSAASASPVVNDTIILDTAPPTGNILVNFGAAYTNQISVTLSLFANDAGSGVAQMRFSNNGSSWSAWETYGTSKAWSLTAGDGLKTVYAQYRDNVGKISASCNDTITLDSAPPSGSVLVNGGAAYTNSTAVTLTLSASDGGSGISEMRFSNNNSTWSAWEAYATTKAWTLTPSDGIKTVYVQFRDTAANASGSYSDTILLDTSQLRTAVHAWPLYW